ncbi:MAG TPA: prepilin-type N-terminal cleavage/methylation domain-containing protein [Coxiellaceae bacterium]|nr:prepilin-type N-terminal cleavage/methylation domain-containing protein [Coxiellaceae bacterium]
MQKIKQFGFTLIELLVVIAIIGILASVVLVSLNSARAKSRDAKRVADIKQIQLALELFYNDNGNYPTETSNAPTPTNGASGFTFNTYLATWPTAPTPPDNPSGSTACTATTNAYDYTATGSTPATYSVSFCLGAPTGGLSAGTHTATPTGIQ